MIFYIKQSTGMVDSHFSNFLEVMRDHDMIERQRNEFDVKEICV